MKPLVLTIHPKRDKVGRRAQPGYVVGKRAVELWWIDSPECKGAKRLTDAELAAEYWSAEKRLGDLRAIAEKYPHYSQIEPDCLAQVLALHRFATTPSYDEVTP